MGERKKSHDKKMIKVDIKQNNEDLPFHVGQTLLLASVCSQVERSSRGVRKNTLWTMKKKPEGREGKREIERERKIVWEIDSVFERLREREKERLREREKEREWDTDRERERERETDKEDQLSQYVYSDDWSVFNNYSYRRENQCQSEKKSGKFNTMYFNIFALKKFLTYRYNQQFLDFSRPTS